MKKKVLLVVMIITISIISFGTINASAATKGTCGENLTWILDDVGTLNIIGTGDMTCWPAYSSAPWYSYRSSINKVVIGDGVTSIGDRSFYNYTNLTNVIIGDNVIKIGSSAFSGCSGLTSITIPDSVESIDKYVFYRCTKLSSVSIGDSVKSIGADAFYDCKGITTITMPASITSIDTGAFNNCTGLTSVYIFDIGSWSSISFANYTSNPLYYAKNLYLNNELVTDVVIPESVTTIGYAAFYNYTHLKNVKIPNSVTSISASAFYNCTNLETLTLGDNVKSIGAQAFYNCTSLEGVYISDIENWCNISYPADANNPLYYAEKLYLNNELLTDLIIPDSVTSISLGAFYKCTNLEKVKIPSSVTSIEKYAFSNCTSLTSVIIPDSVTNIGDGAFRKCTSLESVTISENIKYIHNYTFGDCTSLTSVKIPDGVTSIGKGAFCYSSMLTTVTIPESVTYIDRLAFYVCSNLKKVSYLGTRAQWKQVYIDEYNEPLKNATIDYVAYTKTNVSDDGKVFTITATNVEYGKTVILALYDGDRFLEFQYAKYEVEDITFTTTKTYTKAKVMIWDNLTTLKPVCEVENIQ